MCCRRRRSHRRRDPGAEQKPTGRQHDGRRDGSAARLAIREPADGAGGCRRRHDAGLVEEPVGAKGLAKAVASYESRAFFLG